MRPVTHPLCARQGPPGAKRRTPEDDPVTERKDGWRPIETAPKDGTRILVWVEGAESHEIVGWLGDCWFNGDVTDFMFGDPTHWMPLPEPPPSKLNLAP